MHRHSRLLRLFHPPPPLAKVLATEHKKRHLALPLVRGKGEGETGAGMKDGVKNLHYSK